MSSGERTGARSLVYSIWHRKASIERYLTGTESAQLSMIDIDNCEACCFCSEPVALIEVQVSEGLPKAAPITARLARKANIRAYSVSVIADEDATLDTTLNNGDTITTADILFFRVQQIQPPEEGIELMQPVEYAHFLLDLRSDHWDTCVGAINYKTRRAA